MHHDHLMQIGTASHAVFSTRPFRVSLAPLHFTRIPLFTPGAGYAYPPARLRPAIDARLLATVVSPRARIDADVARKACRAIQRMAGELLGLEKYRAFVGSGRRAQTRIRHIAIYVAHVALGISQQQLADAFGRDRSTVGYCCAVIEDRRDDQAFDGFISLLERVAQAAFAPETVDHG